MHELSEPTRYTPEPDETLTDDVFINARQHGSEVGYSRLVDAEPVKADETAGLSGALYEGLS